MSASPAPGWLTDAVLYQIYPQSFADANGDGIGDLQGVAEHLEHLSWLGVTAIWLNPCFASPMLDAGYDVSDYFTVAPRYGGNEDLAKLVDQARGRGIRVLLDLVPGHTSNRHPWFVASAEDPGDHRYIWAAGDGDRLPAGFVASPGSRPGGYLPNFFDIQPALNFGYARRRADEPWRQPVDAEGPRANRAALREIMSHWLGLGVSGFRVDMASSLVKDDPGFVETGRLWAELRAWLDARHPGAALLSEWGDPGVAVPAGFHADFFLQFGGPTDGGPLRSLWHTRTGTDRDEWEAAGSCYFSAEGLGTPSTFLAAYREAAAAIGEPGHIILPTSNHDFARLHCAPRDTRQLPAAFAFQLTFPTLPAIYYGDEIGMRYVPELPEKEGSVLGPRYNRAGSRTPMQWSREPNAGFSTAPAEALYLPIDPDPDRPDVATQRADPASLLHLVRDLIALRREHPQLGPAGALDVWHEGYPLVYLRGGRYLVAVNPSERRVEYVYEGGISLAGAAVLKTEGARVAAEDAGGGSAGDSGGSIIVEPFGYGIFRLEP